MTPVVNHPPFSDRMAKRSRRKKQGLPSLPDDLIVEILCRVPYRSLCQFKCVSRSWLVLCSDPDIRKRSPQTVSGFFCYSNECDDDDLRFLNISGRGRPLVDPYLPFLRGLGYKSIMFKQCCSGLLSVLPRSHLIIQLMRIMLCAIPQPRSGLCCQIQESSTN